MKFSGIDSPLLEAAEEMGSIAKEALRQRDEARKERDAFRTECVLWRRWATRHLGGGAASDKEQRDLLDHRLVRVAELEAQVEDIRGRALGIDDNLRDAIRALLKTEPTSGELRRALGELVR